MKASQRYLKIKREEQRIKNDIVKAKIAVIQTSLKKAKVARMELERSKIAAKNAAIALVDAKKAIARSKSIVNADENRAKAKKEHEQKQIALKCGDAELLC